MKRRKNHSNRSLAHRFGAVLAATVATLSFTATAALAAPGDVTTLAGSGALGAANGPGISAEFSKPTGVAVDSSGNVFVADSFGNSIRKVTPGGVVSTFATGFSEPYGLAVDNANNIYVADRQNYRVAKVDSTGLVTTLAGSGASSSVDGVGTAASFTEPLGVAVDSSGTVYVSDGFGATVRKVTSVGVVSTLAGSAGTPGHVDGTGSAARFIRPHGIAIDASGANVYIADHSDSTIRKITIAGVATTVAGGSAGFLDSANPLSAQFSPVGIAVDPAGNVYVGDYSNHRIRKIATNGNVTTIAGDGTPAWLDGNGILAQFKEPIGLAFGNSGQLYVADSRNYRIRVIEHVASPAVVANGGIVVTPNPTTAGSPLLVTPQAGCVTATTHANAALSYFILSSTGAVVQQITVPGPPYASTTPVNAAPINTPGSYTIIVGTSASNPLVGCSGLFVVAADGTVPIVDPRVGAGVLLLGVGGLALRRRSRQLLISRA
jgi:sugar lactone lactonase YvrE